MFRRKIKLIIVIVLLVLTGNLFAQKGKPANTNTNVHPAKPKLVVGIVVDQMRYDYLFRYWNKYSESGFKRLINNGFLLKDANYNYVPTYTGPGHACIYTGTTPSNNGIISNDWYDKNLKKSVYCAEDTSVASVGTASSAGKMSPQRLLTTTITDELRLSTNKQSKVIGIALKDRGAILPAGHTANAAYWFDKETSNWITSSYYVSQLPQWVQDFNSKKYADQLLSEKWNTILPIEQYTESTPDQNKYEGLYAGETSPVFPHDLPTIKAKDKDLIKKVPMGNTFTKDFAEAALKGEQLGKGSVTDFLALSFSSTDYVGHMFGINSIETEDTYIRLDRDLSELFDFLDQWVGHQNYLLFLTADHGAANNVLFNADQKIPSGFFEAKKVDSLLENYLAENYGAGGEYIAGLSGHGIYFNSTLLHDKKISPGEIQKKTAEFLMNIKGIATTTTAEELSKESCREGVMALLQKGFNRQRSPDVLISLEPSWVEWDSKTGTTHGAAYSYDTHVPLLFYGWSIPHGSSADPVYVTDIAPTIASLLNIEFPSGTTGKPISSLVNLIAR
jgi:predicted AlkP superfamily pyrophosphatase or phosphodiesterase